MSGGASSRNVRNVLYAASEVAPFVKTGGLADVAGSLPAALAATGRARVRVVLPAYADALANAGNPPLRFDGVIEGLRLRVHEATIVEGAVASGEAPVAWLCDVDDRFARGGNPYHDGYGAPWPDSALRFGLFGRALALLADDAAGLGFRADVVHVNDWQCGLAPIFLRERRSPASSVFTVHNLAYAGLFAADVLPTLGLPSSFFTPDALEFHGQVAFIKGGLGFADRITTVSPTYAYEIATPDYGCGLDGLLRHRQERLSGILNGIDDRLWSPATDPLIACRYDASTLDARAANRVALARAFDIDCDNGVPCVAVVGRLAWQKGIDLLIAALPSILALPARVAVLGEGDDDLARALGAAVARHPGQVGFVAGFDERRAHLVQGGADLLAMPSRYEPCGLTQMYALNYGAVPVARRTGGLADSIIDARASPASGTGFLFDAATKESLAGALAQAVAMWRDRSGWRALQQRGMACDFSWSASAARYLDLYERS